MSDENPQLPGRPQIGVIEPGVIRIETPPAEGCTFVATHLTAAHLVIVWPEADDPNLLRHCAVARDVGRNPKVEQYEAGYGPACSYYQWEAAGNPVHGVRAQD